MNNKIVRRFTAIFMLIALLLPFSPKVMAAEEEFETQTSILRKPSTSVHQMKLWAKSRKADQLFIDLAPLYYSVSVKRGVDPAVTYAQSAKETNFLRFGGVLDATYFNPCGLKTTQGGGDKDPEAHTRFKSWEEGITAQVDHLALYAGAYGYPKANSPDPRHFPGIYGKAPYVEDLGGRWAPSKTYGVEVLELMNEMYKFPYSTVRRIAGNNRFETSALINKAANVYSNVAVVANGHSFPDSIAASILAGNINGHLLLNDPGRVTGEISNLMATGKIEMVYLVGGKNLPQDYVNSLKSQGIKVNVLKGHTRYDTAVKVANQTDSEGIVFLANGIEFPDALSISPIANMKNAKLLFTDGKTINDDVRNIIAGSNEVYIIGGQVSVSKDLENTIRKLGPNVSRIEGQNRYETAIKIANNYYNNPDYVMLASGENFADALSGSALANALKGPIVLTKKDETSNVLLGYLKSKKINTLYVLGGQGSVSKFVENKMKSVLDV